MHFFLESRTNIQKKSFDCNSEVLIVGIWGLLQHDSVRHKLPLPHFSPTKQYFNCNEKSADYTEQRRKILSNPLTTKSTT